MTYAVQTTLGTFTVQRPDAEMVHTLSTTAKKIFIDAFKMTYEAYHRSSGSQDSIETWLKLKGGVAITTWLDTIFEEDMSEYPAKKDFIFLLDPKQELAGWLSHSNVGAAGDVYLSLCCLSPAFHNQKIASTVFAHMKSRVVQLIPGTQEIKLVTRRINAFASRLYVGAGFTKDETIDPSQYGDCYDARYVGFRLSLATS